MRFGERRAEDVTVGDDSTITLTVPTGAVPASNVEVTIRFLTEVATIPDGFTYTNDLPVARAHTDHPDPTAAYIIRQGESLALDGSESTDPNSVAGDAIVAYHRDIDGDGLYDREGRRVLISAAELQSFREARLRRLEDEANVAQGIDALPEADSSVVTLRVTDRHGAVATDTAGVTVHPRPRVFPDDAYRNWLWDAENNKIDNRIEARADDEVVDIVVCFEAGTDVEAAAARVAPFSQAPPVVIPAITSVCLKGVSVSNVRNALAADGELWRVEEEEAVEADLDASSAAIRARPSALYSPQTAFDRGRDGKGVNIAFLDTGADDDHPALAGRFVAGFDAFRDSPGSGTQSNPDDDMAFAGIFHGTHTAEIALGDDPEFPGVASSAGLIEVKVLNHLGQGTKISLLSGLQWCIDNKDFSWAGQPPENHGIDVVCMSLNSKRRSDGHDLLSMMVDAVVASGITVVASAGNSASAGPGFGAPGAADGAITVGALDDQGTILRDDDVVYPHSNFGPRLDDGDGDAIDEMKPDVSAPGVAIRSPSGSIFPFPAAAYTQVTGSSMAAAHVAGVVALLLESAGPLDPATVKQIVRNSAEPRGGPSLPFFDPTWSPFFGKGIVDAFFILPEDLGIVDGVWVASSQEDTLTLFLTHPPSVSSVVPADGTAFCIGGGREPVGISVDGGGNVWLASRLDASVTKLSSGGQVRFRADLLVSAGAAPGADLFGIATDTSDDAWVTFESSNRVVRVRADGTVDGTLYPTGIGPIAVAADRFGNVWVANSGSDDVTQRDSAGNEVPGSPFAVGNEPSAIVCDRLRSSAIVCDRLRSSRAGLRGEPGLGRRDDTRR